MSSLIKIYHRLLIKLRVISKSDFIRKSRNKYEDKYLKNKYYQEITDEELNQYREVWPDWNVKKEDLTWARIYKSVWGFSPYVIGNWHTLLLREKFNPYSQLVSLENKALFDVYFPEIPYPMVYVRRLGNVYYDSKMNVITEDKAIEILASVGSYVIKPAFGTMQGAGVQVVKNHIADYPFIKQSIQNQPSDFIAQELLIQHPDIAKLNPTSVNCCRVTTIFISGKFGYATNLKIGKKGSSVDNWHSSYICGVDEKGRVMEKGFDNKLNIVDKTDLGTPLNEIVIPHYDKIIQNVEYLHKKYFPIAGIVGWDIIVDDKNNPRVIEANLTAPGIVAEQIAVGDFLKDFRKEIVHAFKSCK